MTTSGNSSSPYQPTVTTVTASVDTGSERMTSIQSQIGLLVAAVLTVLSFIFHNDLGALTAPLSLLAFTGYGAAVAIARAMKHRTVVVAQTEAAKMTNANQLIASEFAPNQAVSTAFDRVDNAVQDLHERLSTVEAHPAVAKPARKTTAKKTTSTRRR